MIYWNPQMKIEKSVWYTEMNEHENNFQHLAQANLNPIFKALIVHAMQYWGIAKKWREWEKIELMLNELL